MTAPTLDRTTVCPTWCARAHREEPGEIVVHESADILIPQVPAPLPGSPLRLMLSTADHDNDPRLIVNDDELDLAGAERLLAELAVLVPQMRRAALLAAVAR